MVLEPENTWPRRGALFLLPGPLETAPGGGFTARWSASKCLARVYGIPVPNVPFFVCVRGKVLLIETNWCSIGWRFKKRLRRLFVAFVVTLREQKVKNLWRDEENTIFC